MEKFSVTLPSLDTSQIKSTLKNLRTKNNNQSLALKRNVNLIILEKRGINENKIGSDLIQSFLGNDLY